MCPIESITANSLMLVPFYVYMPKNEKFVLVKKPIDFFSEEELLKYKGFEIFFAPAFVESILPFRDSGSAIRSILNWNKNNPQDPVLPHIVSDAILQRLASLWFSPGSIELYLMAILVDAIVDRFSPEILLSSKSDPQQFEFNIYHSCLAVFLALHHGKNDLEFLNRLRNSVFFSKADTAFSVYLTLAKMLLLRSESTKIQVLDLNCGITFLPLDNPTWEMSQVAEQINWRLFRIRKTLLQRTQPLFDSIAFFKELEALV